MERTLRAKDDLDWMPASFKAFRWAIAGGIWVTIGGVAGALYTFAHAANLYFLGKGVVAMGAGGFYLGDRSARALLRRRLLKLARGHVDLPRLKREADGELVHVRGRIRGRETLQGVLAPVPAVYRRLIVNARDRRFIHEAAVDFTLMDESGESIGVMTDDARLIAAEPKLQEIGGDETQRVQGLPFDIDWRGSRWNPVKLRAGEVLLCEGDEVEVVGYKSRTIDQSMQERMARETPMRAILRGGKALPLLIAPVRS